VRAVVPVAFGFLLLVLGSSLATVIPLHGHVPNLLLPIVLFFGVSAEVPIVRGAASSFLLGYLVDAFTGSPMGLHTFAFVATFLVARGAGLRLLPQGSAFQILMTLVMALGSGALVLALRAIFERAFALDLHDSGVDLLRSAVATALCGPFVFMGMRRIAGLGGPRAEERPAS
jgi:rod shape-determining protein MreD